ncbi:MAG: hypothetical protein HKN73_10080, partial [Gemmatimonadetes bacterium]|nr:hypothetical protein [Gemmatimonadota bacterium]
TLLLAPMAATALGACSDSDTPLALFEPEIANVTDSFQLQASGLTGVTTSVDYNWENTGTEADIDQSGVLTGGEASLTILDAAGSTVYTADLASTGSYQSTSGQAGMWIVRLTTTDAQGDLNFRVQKP